MQRQHRELLFPQPRSWYRLAPQAPLFTIPELILILYYQPKSLVIQASVLFSYGPPSPCPSYLSLSASLRHFLKSTHLLFPRTGRSGSSSDSAGPSAHAGCPSPHLPGAGPAGEDWGPRGPGLGHDPAQQRQIVGGAVWSARPHQGSRYPDWGKGEEGEGFIYQALVLTLHF